MISDTLSETMVVLDSDRDVDGSDLGVGDEGFDVFDGSGVVVEPAAAVADSSLGPVPCLALAGSAEVGPRYMFMYNCKSVVSYDGFGGLGTTGGRVAAPTIQTVSSLDEDVLDYERLRAWLEFLVRYNKYYQDRSVVIHPVPASAEDSVATIRSSCSWCHESMLGGVYNSDGVCNLCMADVLRRKPLWRACGNHRLLSCVTECCRLGLATDASIRGRIGNAYADMRGRVATFHGGSYWPLMKVSPWPSSSLMAFFYDIGRAVVFMAADHVFVFLPSPSWALPSVLLKLHGRRYLRPQCCMEPRTGGGMVLGRMQAGHVVAIYSTPYKLRFEGHGSFRVVQLCNDLALFAGECRRYVGVFGCPPFVSAGPLRSCGYRIVQSCEDLSMFVTAALDTAVRPDELPADRCMRVREIARKLCAYGDRMAIVDSLVGLLSTGVGHGDGGLEHICSKLDMSSVLVMSMVCAVVGALEGLCELSDVACSGPFCVVCGNHSRLVCGACGVTNYCARRCQKIHWRHQHKHVCAYLLDRRITRDRSGSQLAASSFRSNVVSKVRDHLDDWFVS